MNGFNHILGKPGGFAWMNFEPFRLTLVLSVGCTSNIAVPGVYTQFSDTYSYKLNNNTNDNNIYTNIY